VTFILARATLPHKKYSGYALLFTEVQKLSSLRLEPRTASGAMAKVNNLRRKKFRMMCLGFPLFLSPETKAVSGA
jgi:hypothetical protein